MKRVSLPFSRLASKFNFTLRGGGEGGGGTISNS